MDIVIGVLFAVLLIGVATLAGRSLDRARRREHDAKGERAETDADLYGDW